MTYILGIDNGITGSVALMDQTGKVLFHAPVPIYKERKWTKPKKQKLKTIKEYY